jgi:acid phosphatase family membrane protein YuiD
MEMTVRQWLSEYAYFVIPLLAWAVAQISKVFIEGFVHNDWNWRYLYRSGGMPSAHTTVIISLCTVLGYRLGSESPEFGIACILASIVMYDAINVRHAVGEHARALRKIIPEVFKKTMPPDVVIHQSKGHTPQEVLIGIFIGVIVPVFIFIVT